MRSENRDRIDLVGSVGGSDRENGVAVAVDSVELLQELRGELLADRIVIHSALRTGRVNFIDKNERGLFFPGLFEDFRQPVGAPTDIHGFAIGSGERDEVQARFVAQDFGELGFPTTRRPMEKQALREMQRLQPGRLGNRAGF
jgi:hypothetical protein